jgi:glycosyltransferase EpsE
MSDQPLVSVVMTTFNENPNFITESVSSILNQTYTNFELLILDDSMNKDSKKTIDGFTYDKRVKIIRENERMRFVPALNKGLCLAHGKYIARMDGDDCSLPDRIKLQVEYFEKHPDIAVLGGQINIIDETGTINSERLYPTNEKALKRYAIFRCPLAHPTVMFRREIVDKGFTYNEKLKKAEDLDLWLRLFKNGWKLSNLNEKLLNYRVCGSLAKKRSKEQWKNNFQIRKNNYTPRLFVFSICSITMSFMYTLIPNFVFDIYYKKENNQ